jgi:hypothetical protein
VQEHKFDDRGLVLVSDGDLHQPHSSPATDFVSLITPVDIANHPKLLRKVPYTNRSMFNSTMRRPLSDYTRASLQKDSAAQHRSIVEILSIPGQTMISRRGGKKGRQRDIAIMQHRLIERNLASSSTSSFIVIICVINIEPT